MGSSQDIKYKVRAENDSQAAFRALLGDVKGVERELKALTAQSAYTGRAMNDNAARASSGFKNLSASLFSIKSAIAGAGIAYAGREMLDASMKAEALSRGFTVATGSAEAASKELKWLRDTTQSLGVDFYSAADAAKGFTVASRDMGMSSADSRDILKGVMEASVALGLSTEQTSGALNALQQMMSKGNVQAEELRGQLGERIPGAFNMAAKAMGVSTQELNKMLEQGEVLASDLLPKLADVLHDKFGAAAVDAGGSAAAAMARFDTAVMDLKVTIADGGFVEALTDTVKDLTAYVAENKDEVIEFASAIGKIASSSLDAAAGIAKSLTPAISGLAGVIREIPSAFLYAWLGGKLGGPWGAGIGAVAGLTADTWVKWASNDDNADLRAIQAAKGRKSKYMTLDEFINATSAPETVVSAEGRKSGTSPSPSAVAGGGRGGTSAADKAAREAKKAYEEHAKAVEKATEWYAEQTEEVEGAYAANKEFKKITEMLALLQSEGLISKEEEIRQLEYARIALQKFTVAAQNASPDMDKLIGDRPDLFGDDVRNSIDGTAAGLQDIRYAMEQSGIKIKGWNSFVSAYEQYQEYQKLDGGAGSGSALFKSIGSAIQGIGQVVGGGVGNAISSTAGLALAGFEVGGPIGAIVGGVVGLVSSIFGGGSNYEEERAQRDDLRGQIYDNMVESALSGGTESLKLLRATRYNYDALKNYADPGYPGMKSGTSGRLFEDRGTKELKKLQEALSVLDQAGKTINEFMRPGLINDLDSAKVLLEYTIAQVGDLSQATAAYWDSVISTVTGINADSVAELMLNSIALATNSDQAARIFAEGLEQQLVQSLKNMAVAQLVNDVVMEQLQPAMKTIVQGMISGDMTSADMAALVSQAQNLASTIAPVVSELYNAFDQISLNQYVYSGTPIEARAYGGSVTSGQPYIVGDRRQPELFVPGSDGYIFPEVPGSGSGSVQVVMPATIKVQIGDREFNAYLDEQAVRRESRIAVTGNRTARTVY